MPQPSAQSSSIFISYRRDDSIGHAGRLYDRLAAHFGDGQVFMDVDQIEPGEDFVRVIEEAVGSCEVLLAVIGRGWLTSRDEDGRRLDNPNDFVRLELASALARGVRMIPVLVQESRMPRPQDLPGDLMHLTRLNAIELSDLRWRRDVDRLITVLEKIFERQREARRAAEQEEEARRREQEEAKRRQAVEEEKRRIKAKERRAREAAEKERPEESAYATVAPEIEGAGEVERIATGWDPGERTADEPPVFIHPLADDLSPAGLARRASPKLSAMLWPSLVGGVVAGVPSGIPFVSALCIVWSVAGGMLAVSLYRRRTEATVASGDGLRLGVMTGLVGSLLSACIGVPMQYLFSPLLGNEESMRRTAEATGLSQVTLYLIGALIRSVFIMAPSIVGGLIGASRARRR